MTRVVGYTRDELLSRERVFEGLTAKAVKMTTRALTANLSDILTAAPTLSTADQKVVTSTWNSYVAAELFPYLVQTFVDSAGEVYGQIDDLTDDVIPKVDTDFALQYLRKANNRLKAISDVIWSNMREQLAEGYDAGETTLQLAARLRSVSSISEPRALMIARTEIVPAANFASLHQVQLAGFTDEECQKGWLATKDGRTRPEHHDADGQRVGLSQPFTVGGEKMNFPGDWSLGASADNVISCRCSIEYVFDDDEIDTASVSTSEFRWVENDHPRDGDGQFTEKAGGSAKWISLADADQMRVEMTANAPLQWNQEDALRSYSGKSYGPINERLRAIAAANVNRNTDDDDDYPRRKPRISYDQSEDDAHWAKVTTNLHAAMRPTTRDVKARRFVTISAFKTTLEDLKNYVGRTFEEPGFTSTSIDDDYGFGNLDPDYIQLDLDIPAGTKAMYLGSDIGIAGEWELLLDAGTKFTVTDVVLRPNGTAVVKVRVVS